MKTLSTHQIIKTVSQALAVGACSNGPLRLGTLSRANFCEVYQTNLLHAEGITLKLIKNRRIPTYAVRLDGKKLFEIYVDEYFKRIENPLKTKTL